MARRAKSRLKPLPPIRLSEWLDRLGRKPGEVAKKSGISESYISNIINSPTKMPSTHVMWAISEELGISVNDLYNHPPERAITEKVRRLRPDQLSALGTLLDEINPKRRK